MTCRVPFSRRRARRILARAALLLPAATPAAAQRVTLAARLQGNEVPLGMPALPARIAASGMRIDTRLEWRTAQPGVEVATVDLAAGALAASVQAVVVRVDPAHVRFSLQHLVQPNGMSGTWTVDSAPAGAALAMNAGQFKETGPWGWLVIQGEERRTPLRAPLGIAIRVDTAGRIRWITPGREMAARRDSGTAFGFQSFPLLFLDRRVPPALRDGSLVNLGHRDARLVMAESDDGRLLFVLTRWSGLGALAERVPIGLTTPEAVALAAALGARHAVMLDGGVSAQLMVRDRAGTGAYWRGLRTVPLGLVAEPRGPAASQD